MRASATCTRNLHSSQLIPAAIYRASRVAIVYDSMDVDDGRVSASMQKHPEVLRMDISELSSPLPEQVKARWGPYKQRQLARPSVTLDQIKAKMSAADEKRQVRNLLRLQRIRSCDDTVSTTRIELVTLHQQQSADAALLCYRRRCVG